MQSRKQFVHKGMLRFRLSERVPKQNLYHRLIEHYASRLDMLYFVGSFFGWIRPVPQRPGNARFPGPSKIGPHIGELKLTLKQYSHHLIPPSAAYNGALRMHHIVYMSRATSQMTLMSLVTLLLQARDANERAAVTGALIYGDGQQVMEGEEAVITALYERVVRDPRHRNVFKLADKPIAERSFLKWTMAFREVSPGEFEDLVGYTSPEQWAQISFGSDSVDVLLLERMRALVLFDESIR